MRKKQKKGKLILPPIIDQISVIKAEICDQLCKWPERIEDEGVLWKEHCQFCPLGKL